MHHRSTWPRSSFEQALLATNQAWTWLATTLSSRTLDKLRAHAMLGLISGVPGGLGLGMVSCKFFVLRTQSPGLQTSHPQAYSHGDEGTRYYLGGRESNLHRRRAKALRTQEMACLYSMLISGRGRRKYSPQHRCTRWLGTALTWPYLQPPPEVQSCLVPTPPAVHLMCRIIHSCNWPLKHDPMDMATNC